VVTALARKIVAGGPASLPALLAAIRRAGIRGRDASAGNKVFLDAASPAQGISIQAGEVIAVARLEARGYRLSLNDLATVVARMAPAGVVLGPAQLQKAILAGIRSGADAKSPTRRFWARLITKLGRLQKPSYDLFGKPRVGAVQLDAVQTSLILLRLSGDLLHAAR
jgi:hypothetical protein